jgi:hypothetical protein
MWVHLRDPRGHKGIFIATVMQLMLTYLHLCNTFLDFLHYYYHNIVALV